jgi:hypothetical protein
MTVFFKFKYDGDKSGQNLDFLKPNLIVSNIFGNTHISRRPHNPPIKTCCEVYIGAIKIQQINLKYSKHILEINSSYDDPEEGGSTFL